VRNWPWKGSHQKKKGRGGRQRSFAYKHQNAGLGTQGIGDFAMKAIRIKKKVTGAGQKKKKQQKKEIQGDSGKQERRTNGKVVFVITAARDPSK